MEISFFGFSDSQYSSCMQIEAATVSSIGPVTKMMRSFSSRDGRS